MSNINQYLWGSSNKTWHPDQHDLKSAYYCRNRKVWEILQLWYRDAYEESQQKYNTLCKGVKALQSQEIRLKRSNFALRRSSRIQQRTIQVLRGENQVLHDVFARMRQQFPQEFATLTQDLPFFEIPDNMDTVARELYFDQISDSD